MSTTLRITTDRIYVLSNEELTEEIAFDALIGEVEEEVNFLEFDKSVASEYGFKECAIFEII